ncbi:ras family-domain-containing protein [Anaeramoeba flamelloides]|uniref:Ras family-domain-containing protein n=1 Tax=Anaeramoeba flamelloides TaxID=1746091 RepID=A0AAV7ZXP4_9EUKA|nr:ras family-domain-containing protein [Anaeramoeba flamelloides]KAJ6249970.1 ras family-domain-containing protein [Anaeramoeba flamelloides]
MADQKIVLLGDSGVGKTCFVHKLVYDRFNSQEPSTMGASFLKKTYEAKGNKIYEFAIWDTAGQERFDSLATFYTRDAGCGIIVFDITSRASFEDLDRLYKKLEYADKRCYSILVGSKLDLVLEEPNLRAITKEEAQQYADKKNSTFFECSSKTGNNIPELWEEIGKQYVRIKQEKKKNKRNKLNKKLEKPRNTNNTNNKTNKKNPKEKIQIKEEQIEKNKANKSGGCC